MGGLEELPNQDRQQDALFSAALSRICVPHRKLMQRLRLRVMLSGD